ncbi:MAG: hypothetical protein EXR36_14430 [Betaproteobacteria bacterium]|nr:hypothetical protein [Betaproteobacteria bacterium]
MNSNTGRDRANVDLGEVSRLVETLAEDLAKVREGSADLDTLRSEVEQLRTALQATEGDHAGVHAGLSGIRSVLGRIEDEVLGDALTASDYIARIGRMLGM